MVLNEKDGEGFEVKLNENHEIESATLSIKLSKGVINILLDKNEFNQLFEKVGEGVAAKYVTKDTGTEFANALDLILTHGSKLTADQIKELVSQFTSVNTNVEV